MSEAPQSNRPTPRTTAAVEAELRRQIRTDLAQAREDADGELDDASLASIVARAIGVALGWHLESPEHARNATQSSRTWRPAGGPRGGGPRQEFSQTQPQPRGGGPRQEFSESQGSPEGRGPRSFDDRRRGPPPGRAPFSDRAGPRDFEARNAPPRRGPRDDDRDGPPRRGPRDDDAGGRERDFPPRRGPQPRPSFGPRSGGRPQNRSSSGGGFGPRRPPPRGR